MPSRTPRLVYIPSRADIIIHYALQVARSPYLVLAVTQGGGHLGWYERTNDGRLGRWYVKPVVQFLAALLEVSSRRRISGKLPHWADSKARPHCSTARSGGPSPP